MLRCGWIITDHFIIYFLLRVHCARERIWIIGQYLTKLCKQKVCVGLVCILDLVCSYEHK